MPPKKPPASTPGKSASASAPPPAASTTKKTGDTEVDTIVSRMKKLEVSKQLEWGFNFNGPLPYFWWTYIYDGAQYLKMEILMAVTWHLDIQPSISVSGEYLIVYCKIPNHFLNLGRLFGYYNDANNGDVPTFTENDSMFVQGVAATRGIKAALEVIGGAKQTTTIKLPFKVLANFVDHYHPDGTGTGYGLRSYPHENNPNGGQVKFTVLSLTMQDATTTRIATVLQQGADVATDADVMNRFK